MGSFFQRFFGRKEPSPLLRHLAPSQHKDLDAHFASKRAEIRVASATRMQSVMRGRLARQRVKKEAPARREAIEHGHILRSQGQEAADAYMDRRHAASRGIATQWLGHAARTDQRGQNVQRAIEQHNDQLDTVDGQRSLKRGELTMSHLSGHSGTGSDTAQFVRKKMYSYLPEHKTTYGFEGTKLSFSLGNWTQDGYRDHETARRVAADSAVKAAYADHLSRNSEGYEHVKWSERAATTAKVIHTAAPIAATAAVATGAGAGAGVAIQGAAAVAETTAHLASAHEASAASDSFNQQQSSETHRGGAASAHRELEQAAAREQAENSTQQTKLAARSGIRGLLSFFDFGASHSAVEEGLGSVTDHLIQGDRPEATKQGKRLRARQQVLNLQHLAHPPARPAPSAAPAAAPGSNHHT